MEEGAETNRAIPGFGRVADVVDLGLSVKWASWNVGASRIADYGGLYGAGDPTGQQTSTNYNDYYWTKGANICGTQYDLAHVLWGELWRLPTINELKELKEKCSWQYDVEIDGIKGCIAKGPNGNELFIPYAGSRRGSSNNGYTKWASIWSGEEGYAGNDTYTRSYKDLDINLPSGSIRLDGCECHDGQSIRPVYSQNGVPPVEGGADAGNISVSTFIMSANSHPIYVGGFISNYTKDVISKKGVIISKNNNDLIITNSTQFVTSNLLTNSNEPGYNKPENLRFIDCTNLNEEEYIISLTYLEGNTDYYVKAFAITNDNTILYGNTEKIHSLNFSRYIGGADVANVWHAFSNTLFDLSTDEIIDPNDGFYYSTNENPTKVGHQIGTGYNTCYKFATEWNYKLWYYHNSNHCNKSKIVFIPTMKYKNGKLEIMKAEKDKDKTVSIYYSINGNGMRPEYFTDKYSEPITVNDNSVVYCYAISSDGYISYTNQYLIMK